MTTTIERGLQFTNVHMAGTFTIWRVREYENKVDVVLPDGYPEYGWNLQHTIWGFEKNEYVKLERMSHKAHKDAIRMHDFVNDSYGMYPKSLHLNAARDVADAYIHLVDYDDRESVLAAVSLHDTVEDCRQTYNNVKDEYGQTIADLVWACSGFGKNRKERNECSYEKVRVLKNAAFVKFCDRIANTGWSKLSGSSMLKKYQQEFQSFIEGISGIDKDQKWFKAMWECLGVIVYSNADGTGVPADLNVDKDDALSTLEFARAQYNHYLKVYGADPGIKRAYISGKISGVPNGNKSLFEMWENRLMDKGYMVLNPHTICAHLNQETTVWEEYMRVNVPAMLKCEIVVLLPKWEESEGAIWEFFVATRFGIPAVEAKTMVPPVLTNSDWIRLIQTLTSGTMIKHDAKMESLVLGMVDHPVSAQKN